MHACPPATEAPECDPRAGCANTLIDPPYEADHPNPVPQRGADAPRRRSPTCRARSTASTTIELLVVDDGSTDRTVEVAREHGVEHIVRLTNNKGLAAGFQAGLDACLKLGADIVVNTDADNQYQGADVAKLVAPILAGEADMVVGDRQVAQIDHFSGSKKGCSGSAAGSCGGSRAPRSPTPPPASAPTTARRRCSCSVVDNFTYTLESLIQAGKMLVAVDQVAVGTNPADPRVAAVRLDRRLRAPQRPGDPADLRPLRAAAGVRHRRADRLRAGPGGLDAVPARLDLQRRQHRPHPVADPRRRPLHRRRAALRARRDRRPAGRAAGDDAAGLRAGAAGRAGARRRALPLRAPAPSRDR